jgi:hypothetical protein
MIYTLYRVSSFASQESGTFHYTVFYENIDDYERRTLVKKVTPNDINSIPLTITKELFIKL